MTDTKNDTVTFEFKGNRAWVTITPADKRKRPLSVFLLSSEVAALRELLNGPEPRTITLGA
jgi:hypothetical protein